MTSRNRGWPLAASQQGDGVLSSIAARNWILSTTGTYLRVDSSSPLPPEMNMVLPVPLSQLHETLSWELRWGSSWTSALQSCELINGCRFKPLRLGCDRK